MSDSDWAGVLSRWGNGVEDMTSSSKTTSSVTSREARHSSSMASSSTMSTSMTSNREVRTGSGVLGSLNRGSEDGMEAGKRSGWGHQGLARSESQLRDRAERSASAAAVASGAASGGSRSVSRPRWSYRGSESPGKENVEAGDR